MTTYYNQNGMSASQKRDLTKAFEAYASRMMNTHHLYSLIKHQIGADIKTGDYVISTDLYDSSIFVVPTLVKTRTKKRVPLPNPYECEVVDSSHNAFTRRATSADTDKRKEMRIKVRKLSLLMWNAEKNEYPVQSVDIIFRQRIINFAEQYESELNYARKNVSEGVNEWRTAEMIEKMKADIEVMEQLIAIPPFLAFYDNKYGFLIKREVKMNKIVFEPIHQTNAKEAVGQAFTEAKNQLIEEAKKKDEEDLSFKEAIVREALHPKRMGAYVEKHGIDGAMEMFDPREEKIW